MIRFINFGEYNSTKKNEDGFNNYGYKITVKDISLKPGGNVIFSLFDNLSPDKKETQQFAMTLFKHLQRPINEGPYFCSLKELQKLDEFSKVNNANDFGNFFLKASQKEKEEISDQLLSIFEDKQSLLKLKIITDQPNEKNKLPIHFYSAKGNKVAGKKENIMAEESYILIKRQNDWYVRWLYNGGKSKAAKEMVVSGITRESIELKDILQQIKIDNDKLQFFTRSGHSSVFFKASICKQPIEEQTGKKVFITTLIDRTEKYIKKFGKQHGAFIMVPQKDGRKIKMDQGEFNKDFMEDEITLDKKSTLRGCGMCGADDTKTCLNHSTSL